MGWGVGRTWLPAAESVPGFLTAGLVGFLVKCENCEMADLVHAPGILGLCKEKDEKAGWQAEAPRSAGRCHHHGSGCEGPELPALGQQCRSFPPKLRDLGLGLCIQAQDDKMGSRIQSRCA